MPRETRPPRDNGAGAVLGIAAIAGILIAASLFGLVTKIGQRQLQLQNSVDLAALAGNQTFRGLSTGIPCDRAKQILTINMSKLESCLIVGEVTTVAGTSSVMGIVLSATATAAPQ